MSRVESFLELCSDVRREVFSQLIKLKDHLSLRCLTNTCTTLHQQFRRTGWRTITRRKDFIKTLGKQGNTPQILWFLPGVNNTNLSTLLLTVIRSEKTNLLSQFEFLSITEQEIEFCFINRFFRGHISAKDIFATWRETRSTPILKMLSLMDYRNQDDCSPDYLTSMFTPYRCDQILQLYVAFDDTTIFDFLDSTTRLGIYLRDTLQGKSYWGSWYRYTNFLRCLHHHKAYLWIRKLFSTKGYSGVYISYTSHNFHRVGLCDDIIAYILTLMDC